MNQKYSYLSIENIKRLIKRLIFLLLISFISYSFLELIRVCTKDSFKNSGVFISTLIFIPFVWVVIIYWLKKISLDISNISDTTKLYCIAVFVIQLIIPLRINLAKYNYEGVKASDIESEDYRDDGENVDLKEYSISYDELFLIQDSLNISNSILKIKREHSESELQIYKDYFLFPTTSTLYGYKTIQINNNVYPIKGNIFDGIFVTFEWFVNSIEKFFIYFIIVHILDIVFIRKMLSK